MGSNEVPSKNADFGPLEFPKDFDVNDDLSSEETLSKIADYPLLDVDGKQVPFRSVYEGINEERKNHKVLVIFVRHFYCGYCQDYVEYLAKGLPSPTELEALPKPASVIIIGCGAPSLISFYADKTSCPFPIYAEPSRRLYSALTMTKSLARSETLPEYLQTTNVFRVAIKGASQALSRVMYGDASKPGPVDQIGGEFMFEGGKVTWCHRMRNMTDHSDLRRIKEIIGLPVAVESTEVIADSNTT